ncbi:hypothetical protein [Salegentibacter sp. 24]|uniref:hypothetical protein n=1 Tax=Salegentibacter sp. 24 TaxID=2183986 RepID=UPI00141527AD|nr:hypothetical protein [Salegentibacter sp. 24]
MNKEILHCYFLVESVAIIKFDQNLSEFLTSLQNAGVVHLRCLMASKIQVGNKI